MVNREVKRHEYHIYQFFIKIYSPREGIFENVLYLLLFEKISLGFRA